MTTLRMCKVCNGWHDLDQAWPEKCFYGGRRGGGMSDSAPYVISDAMAPIKHMGTGQYLDSKSKFRQATSASGCIEIGNETVKPRQPIKLDSGKRREAIRKSIYELRNGR